MKSLYVCAALLVAMPVSAQAGVGRFYCEGGGKFEFDWADKQNTLLLVDDKGNYLRKWTFPTSQRYIQIREPAIWIDTKGYKTGPDGKSYSATFDGKPCEMRGYDH